MEPLFGPWLDWLLQTPWFGPVNSLLSHFDPVSTFVTGGAVRDFVLGRPSSEVRDLDLLYTGDFHQLGRVLRADYDVTLTPFGNPSIALSDRLHADVFPPASPYGMPLELHEALAHSDASGNALGLPVDGSQLVDPVKGYADLRRRRTRLLDADWESPGHILVALLERVVEQSTRLGLRVDNVEVSDRAQAKVTRSTSYPSDDRAQQAVNAYSAWRRNNK